MYNYTIEDYKKAIKAKYEIEKQKVNFAYLESPSQGKLRDLCWEKFVGEVHQDDLKVFSDFFGFQFDPAKKNFFKDQKDKFRPIVSFFKGKTDLANIEAVDLAAVLVDFHNRPFNKYRTKGRSEEMVLGDLKEVMPDNYIRDTEKPKNLNELPDHDIKTFTNTIGDKTKFTPLKYLGAATVVCLISLIIYLALPEKQCMQWSNDHYEIVDCDLKIEGIGMANKIELLDKSLVNLKKVNVCDTTTCFDKNGQAIIWYGKTANGIDFFDGHGRHPESNSPLRPVTRYILNKYVKK